jgi:hypothetical protein
MYSQCHGTILLFSPTLNSTIEARKVLLLEDCANKLIPVSPFVQKGCSVIYNNYDKVTVMTEKEKVLLSGIEKGGLYYYDCVAVKGNCIQKKEAELFFGLPLGRSEQNLKSPDFSKQLLETHFSLGHLSFDKCRKILGLGKGDNPLCAICAAVKSRRDKIEQPYSYKRSDRINHRMHMDVGYTRGSEVIFHL